MSNQSSVPALFSAVLHVNVPGVPSYDEELPLEFLDGVGLRVRPSGLELVRMINTFIDRSGRIRFLTVSLPPNVRPFFDRVHVDFSSWISCVCS